LTLNKITIIILTNFLLFTIFKSKILLRVQFKAYNPNQVRVSIHKANIAVLQRLLIEFTKMNY